ncbi:MAG: hypothetical protein JEZ01_13520 [Labilibaculum sp.]|nr:hypothetical protein [Labilibaculum sp.]MBI9058777.1 hypothetical protein [Labilibaculum sp.]
MTKDLLLESAQKLQQVEEQFLKEYTKKRENLVTLMNQKMQSRADIKELVGEDNLELMKDNHANHARFLESLFCEYSADVFMETVLWVFKSYSSRGFSSLYWSAQLNTWVELYKEELTKECFAAIYPYYNWMIVNIPSFKRHAVEELDSTKSEH